ncbi:MAG: ABC transporter substrate-binding protein [Thermaceae bacterium]|nr:ABC transporter substrate-binding protein [Thermaceae bacterium]
MYKLRSLVFAAALMMGLALAQTQVTFWTSATNPPDVKALKDIVAAFNAANPKIVVKLVQVTGSETDAAKLMTAVAGGTGPDVYMLDRFTVAERAAAGLLEDLNPFGANALASNYLPYAWAETQFNGQTYALPFDTDARVLYYRKDMLKAAGVDPNVLDPSKGVPSIKLIQDIAAKINKTDSSGAYTQLGFIPWFNQGWHYTWGWAFGGSFYDAKTCKVTPDNPGVVAGFQFLYDWAKNLDPQKVQTFLSTYAPPNYPPAQDPFVTGKLAMIVTGDWFLETMKQYAPNVDYGITYIPTPDGKKTTWAGGWSMVVPKGAKQPAAAWEFLKYIAGAPGQRIYTKESAHLPTWKALLNDNSLYDARHMFFKNLLPSANSRPPLPVGALYWDELTNAMNKVTLNQQQPMAALEEASSRVNAQLQQFCK